VSRLREADTTVLLDTHELTEAEELCDRVVAMREGRILDQGTPTELVARHGGGATVQFGGFAAAADAEIRPLEGLPGVEDVTRQGDQVLVRGSRESIAHVSAWLISRPDPIPDDLRVDVPTLETALITLLNQSPIGVAS